MHIRKGDNVKMLVGKDRGKTGKVLHVNTKTLRVTIEGLNTAKRHMKPKKQGQKGEIVTIPRSTNISNVAIVCGNCKKNARIQYRADGKSKVRVCAKCDVAL